MGHESWGPESSSASTIAIVIAILLLASPAVWKPANAAEGSGLPDPALDTPLAAKKGKTTAVVAGGCFWGVQLFSSTSKGLKMLPRGIQVAR